VLCVLKHSSSSAAWSLDRRIFLRPPAPSSSSLPAPVRSSSPLSLLLLPLESAAALSGDVDALVVVVVPCCCLASPAARTVVSEKCEHVSFANGGFWTIDGIRT
jgi:hypothetical protein